MVKSGYSYIFVGAPGAGKSTLMKALTRNVARERLHVYDVNNEYGLNDYADLPDMKDFLKEMIDVKKSVIIFEDATPFFSNRGRSEMMTKLLALKRHRKNVIFLAFHSIRAIPFYIYDLMIPGGIFVLKTNDSRELVDKRIPGLLEAFDFVQNNKPTQYPKHINFKYVQL